MEIGHIIKLERTKNNLSQEDVAKFIGSTKQAVYKYETGIVTNIPMDKIEKMAALFGVTPSYLMGWDASLMSRQILSENKTPDEQKLTEGEEMLLELFRQIPEAQQKVFLEMGRVYANSLKKG